MEIEEIETIHKAGFLSFAAEMAEKDPATSALCFPGERVWTELEFARYLKQCAEERMDWRPRAGNVSRTRYVLPLPDGQVAAFGVLEFPLDDESENSGGNLFVAVKPSLRGKGYGAFALSRLLFEAVRAGLRRALVSCEAGNIAARRVIEKNRGELFDEVTTNGRKRCRYWIDFRSK